jgi:hypothetical protein
MSNQMQVPAHIAARIAARKQDGKKSSLADAIVSSGPSIPRISTRAGRYRLVENGVETTIGTELDVIIVGVNPRVSKVFYGSAYDPKAENVGPKCSSSDGITPDSNVNEPVNKSCATCPHNVLGSKILPSGAKSKMCADQRHLAVVAAADPTKVYNLTVPVSGMKALREYFTDLGNYNIGPEEAVTELGFDDEASYPKLTFKQKGYVPEKALPLVDSLLESDETKIAIRIMPPTETAPAIAAPQAKAEIAPPKPTAEDDEASAYEEAPAPVAEKPQEPVAPKVEPVKASDELSAKLDDLFG